MKKKIKKDNKEEWFIQELRLEVWKKAIGNEEITYSSHHYATIRTAIKEQTGNLLHQDTIRNFIKGTHTPQSKLLDVYSTFVLGGTENNPKTFQDFQNWKHGSSTYEKLAKVLKEGKKGFYVIMGTLLVITALVTYPVCDSSKTVLQDPPYETVKLNNPTVSSGLSNRLDKEPPTKNLIEEILADFPFDNKEEVSKEEAQRIMEWLGIRIMKFKPERKGPFFFGELPTECNISLWVGTYGKQDTYGLRCKCENADFTLAPYYLEVAKPQATVPFFEKFTTSNLDSLRDNGWDLLFPDIKKWESFQDGEYPTLATWLGDSWLDNVDYEPIVQNILAREINCGDCCEIKVKMLDFNPYQRYQQAGIYLFYDEYNAYPSLRYTLTFPILPVRMSPRYRMQAVWRKAEYHNERLFQSVKTRADAITWKKEDPPYHIDSLIFQIQVKGNQYSFSYKVNEKPPVLILTRLLSLDEPLTLGLAAFQGRPDIPSPIFPVADTIPARFEYVEIIPCDGG